LINPRRSQPYEIHNLTNVVKRNIIKLIIDKQNQETTPPLLSAKNVFQKRKCEEKCDVDDYDYSGSEATISQVTGSCSVLRTLSRDSKNKKRKVDILQQRSGQNSGVLSGSKSSCKFRRIVQFIKDKNGYFTMDISAPPPFSASNEDSSSDSCFSLDVTSRRKIIINNWNGNMLHRKKKIKTKAANSDTPIILKSGPTNSHTGPVDQILGGCHPLIPQISGSLPPTNASVRLRYVVIDGCNVAMR